MTKLTFEALEVLDAIDRKGSFAAAAAALYRVPSAITYSVQKLEDDLGVVLFTKQGRRSVLTPAGQVLLEQGREILAATERLVEQTRQTSRGWESSLSIVVDTIVDIDKVYQLVERFYLVQPDIEISIKEEVLAGTWEALIKQKADLAIGTVMPPNTSGLQSKILGCVEWMFAVSPSHPLAQLKGEVSQEDIRQHRAVVISDSSIDLPALSIRVFDKQAKLKVASMQQKIAAQAAGLGVGYLPKHRIQTELDNGSLVALPVTQEQTGHDLCALWRRGSKGKALRWFIEALDDWSF